MTKDVISTNEMISRNAVISMLKGEKKEERNSTPRINDTFVRFEPIAFAVARRIRPFLTAIMLRLNSGKDVPKATTNAPISIGFMPIEAATSKAEDTVNLAEIRTIKVPNRILTKVTVLLMPSFFPEVNLPGTDSDV